MPNAALNAVTAPDQYNPKVATLDTGQWIEHFNLDVANQPIYWQMKQASRPGDGPQMATWQAEVYMLPGSRTIKRRAMTGAQFRAAIPAGQLPAGSSQAVVTLEVVS